MNVQNTTVYRANVPPSPDNESWLSIYVLLLLLYPLVCALLRNHRLRTTYKTFPYSTRASFASMTDTDAQQIQQIFAELEFPFTFEKALQFALFRSYGIPTIAKLLVATSQFSEPSTACKRYVDTVILISEFMGYKPTEERTREAIGRMNYIHSVYRKSGKILDDDMLYTLALFALEPVRWINKYEWRKLEDMEVCAVGTFWKSVGDAMGISWEKLKSGTGGKEGTWKDGLQWFEEIEEWSEQYEKECMVPNVDSHKTANETTRILLWSVPGPVKGAGKNIVSALMDQRLRDAMMCVYGLLNFYTSTPFPKGPDADRIPAGIRNRPHIISLSSLSFSASANSSSVTLCRLAHPSSVDTTSQTILPRMGLTTPGTTPLRHITSSRQYGVAGNL